MAEYDKAIAAADKLLRKKGTNIILTKPSTTNTDSLKPWRGATTIADQVADETRNNKGVFAKFIKSEIDGKNILISDYKIIMPVNDVNGVEITESEMTTYKTLTANSKIYRIIDFDVSKPGDQVILYKIQARV